MDNDLIDHLKTGDTSVCRAWRVIRRDGVKFGFTDHDMDLAIDGLVYSARTGLTARALQQTTGMSVDNSEAMGALSDHSISEQDISAGRFDGAEVTVYLVNWRNPHQRKILFRGNFGEISRENGSFRVELRGLTERLNLTSGLVYQRSCSAQLGDKRCKVDLSAAGMQAVGVVEDVHSEHELTLSIDGQYDANLFNNGVFTGKSGANADLASVIRSDVTGENGLRRITLWNKLFTKPSAGDQFVIVAGCDKRRATCQEKFANAINFRGFPDIPGDEWLRRPPEQKKKPPVGASQLSQQIGLGNA
ncbi:DUF2163 domain-containing protein [Thioclava sp. FR2]|uniref:DUF2163 domain-containing protein n=1 Tax=Thioclava sp. FR2 TaxID=3445780 RepID=UPI003EBDFDFD